MVIACLGSLSARAQDARLSDRGRTLLSGALRASWSNNDGTSQRQLPFRWEARATPSVLYFVRDRVGLGAYAGYGYTRDPAPQWVQARHAVEVGVQAAYEVELAPRLGWLLIASAGYAWTHTSFQEPAAREYWDRTQSERSSLPDLQLHGRRDLIQGAIFAPLVFHVSRGLGLGLGPELAVDVYLNIRDRDEGNRYVQVRLAFGSWLGASF